MLHKVIILTISIFVLFSCTAQKPLQLNLSTNKTEKTANLLVPNDIVLCELNGKNIDNPYTNKPMVYRIDTGNQELSLKFYCLWRNNNGENILLKSKKVKISYNFEENKSYRVAHDPMNDFDQALKLEKDPVFYINLVVPDNSYAKENTTNQNVRSLESLKIIWNKASDQEKKEFLEWAQKQ